MDYQLLHSSDRQITTATGSMSYRDSKSFRSDRDEWETSSSRRKWKSESSRKRGGNVTSSTDTATQYSVSRKSEQVKGRDVSEDQSRTFSQTQTKNVDTPSSAQSENVTRVSALGI